MQDRFEAMMEELINDVMGELYLECDFILE